MAQSEKVPWGTQSFAKKTQNGYPPETGYTFNCESTTAGRYISFLLCVTLRPLR